MRKKTFFAFFLASFIEAWSSPCPDGAIEGRGFGKDRNDAIEAANREIARQINSSMHSVSTNSYLKTETDDSFEESENRHRESKEEIRLLNEQAVKDGRLPYEKNGQYISERYICKSAAAKPYLNELKHLKDSLKISVQKINREACRGTLEVYNKIRIYEGIAENLGQMDKSLKKEYDAFYEKIKQECAKAGRGVYIKSELDYLKKETGSHLTKNGCWISPTEEDANLVLVLDAEEEVKSSYGMFYCNVNVGMDLQSIKAGKSIGNGNIKEKGSWTDRETACKEAGKKAAVEIWDKIKDKIQKEGCK